MGQRKVKSSSTCNCCLHGLASQLKECQSIKQMSNRFDKVAFIFKAESSARTLETIHGSNGDSLPNLPH